MFLSGSAAIFVEVFMYIYNNAVRRISIVSPRACILISSSALKALPIFTSVDRNGAFNARSDVRIVALESKLRLGIQMNFEFHYRV